MVVFGMILKNTWVVKLGDFGLQMVQTQTGQVAPVI